MVGIPKNSTCSMLDSCKQMVLEASSSSRSSTSVDRFDNDGIGVVVAVG